jgi:hypothetical protein
MRSRTASRVPSGAAGLREIPLLAHLRDELAAHKANASAGPDEFVFPTAAGTMRDKDNLRNRVLAPVRFPSVTTWTEGLIERQTDYMDIAEARAAAERLAQERA